MPRLSLIHISEPTRLLSISYAVFCLKKKNIAEHRDQIAARPEAADSAGTSELLPRVAQLGELLEGCGECDDEPGRQSEPLREIVGESGRVDEAGKHRPRPG